MATISATKAEKMAALERAWNGFDMQEVWRKCDAEAEMNGETFRLKVSNLWKTDSMTYYEVSVDAKSRYAVHSKSVQKKYGVDESPGYWLGQRAMFLHYFTPSTPIVLKNSFRSSSNGEHQENAQFKLGVLSWRGSMYNF